MGVTVSAENSVSVVVENGNAVSVDVAQTQQSGVDAYGGLGPTIVVSGTATGIVGTLGINPFVAGPNITITTAGGSITVIGRTPPVLSVNGKTGSVTIQAVDIPSLGLSPGWPGIPPSLSADVYTVHDIATTIYDRFGYIDCTRINKEGCSGDYTIPGVPLVADSDGNLRESSRYVASVNNKTGTVTLSYVDIANFSTGVLTSTPVLSVQGKTGSVVLTSSDVTAASETHNHGNITSAGKLSGSQTGGVLVVDSSGYIARSGTVSNQIVRYGGPGSEVNPDGVVSFAGATGRPVVLALPYGGSTSSGLVMSPGSVAPQWIDSSLGNDDLYVDLAYLEQAIGQVDLRIFNWYQTSQTPAGKGVVSAGGSGKFLRTSSGFVHTLSGCTGTVTIVAGANVTVSPDPANSQIIISSSGGGGGGGGGSGSAAIWPALIFGG